MSLWQKYRRIEIAKQAKRNRQAGEFQRLEDRQRQDVLLFKGQGSHGAAAHRRQVVPVRIRWCDEDRAPMDIRSAQDLLL